MSNIALVRDSTQVIAQNVTVRGKQLASIDRLFMVAADVAKLSKEQIGEFSNSLSAMLAATKADASTLLTHKKQIDADLAAVVTPLSVGNNAARSKVHAETQAELRALLPGIAEQGGRLAQLHDKIVIVQAKVGGDVAPQAAPFCGLTKKHAWQAAYVLGAVALVALGYAIK